MRKLNPMLQGWLQTWGYCEQKRIGLEYPSLTPEARLYNSPGRCTYLSNSGPTYEPNATAVMIGNAVRLMENQQHSQVLAYRYVDQCSYADIKRITQSKSEHQAKWMVEKAIREIASILGVPAYY